MTKSRIPLNVVAAVALVVVIVELCRSEELEPLPTMVARCL